MSLSWRSVSTIVCSSLVVFGMASETHSGQPLSSEQIVQLHQLGINSSAIVEKIKDDGTDFAADTQVLAELEGQGVAAEVLSALQNGPKSQSGDLITYDNVKQLLELGIDEQAIVERLAASPTIFTIDAIQERELQDLGASKTLFAALRGERPAPAKAGEKVTDVAVILDCSGSMNELTSDGKLKIDVAKLC